MEFLFCVLHSFSQKVNQSSLPLSRLQPQQGSVACESMRWVVFRVLGVTYCVFFILYFIFRAVYSIGTRALWWRIPVLCVEFLSSVSVFFVVIMKLRYPWTDYVGQEDGTQMKGLLDDHKPTEDNANKATEDVKDGLELKTDDEKDREAEMALQQDLDDEVVSTPQSRLVGNAGFGDETKEKGSEYGASERLDEDEDGDEDDFDGRSRSRRSGGTTVTKVSMAADRVGQEAEPEEFLAYTVRVLVPCYKEGLDIVQPTLTAALKMKHDADKLFVYLCDDGNDPEKEKWCKDMNAQYPNLIYITRPKEFKGHGKAGNLNYTLREVIYKNVLHYNRALDEDPSEEAKKKRRKYINRKEIVAIFDADMVAKNTFLTRLLPYFARNRRCVMVQSPQTFHNVPMDADFFDAHNINFFQYMLPSFGSWNTTTCCGTNFLVAARALQTVNFFPTISVTEDMYLAMLLLAAGGIIDYHSENLVVGEAPQDLRQIFQQRSRWAKGTIQIFYKDNPLLKKGLPLMARLSFFNACWSYFTSAFFNPLFVMINAAGILFGLFPVADLTFSISMLFVIYYLLFYSMIHATPVPHKHLIGLWVVGKMGHFFSFMSLKAIWNITLSMIKSGKTITFKVTNKKAKIGAQQKVEKNDRDSTHKDIVYHWVMSTIIIVTILYGIWEVSGGTQFLSFNIDDERNVYQRKGIQVFMTFWMVQFLIAYSLPLWYAYLPQDFSIQAAALKYLSMLDLFLSLALIVLTALLFKVPFLIALPTLNAITDFTPATKAFWISDTNALTTVGGYVYDSALDSTIPSVVVYMRPNRDEDLMSSGGLADWNSYRNALSSLASTVASKNFDTIVIFEPDWIYEAMYVANDTTDSHYYGLLDEVLSDYTTAGERYTNVSSAGDILVAWNVEKWYQAIGAFVQFVDALPSKCQVYIDAGNPYYLSTLKQLPLQVLNASLYGKPISFRGVSLNVANFYSDDYVMEYASKYIYQPYGWHYIIDTSRNGGTFSERTVEEINSCRFDPPEMNSGQDPAWYMNQDSVTTSTGTLIYGFDAALWVKVLGEADGRMYSAGEYHDCLINHNIECSDTCPLIPYRDDISGKFIWPSKCKCD
eukprot:TRINITY_DN78186_c0_g1_i1.p1 TRINITY_DN78186_c0_g1~~TRINITY_DN78186_c0_g1_i1.p1  ORF type:complete len:1100 (+),score=339.37 TRINITY_DN78186_c0_g1_i1:176-3475(+)